MERTKDTEKNHLKIVSFWFCGKVIADKNELAETIRGVSISGSILETLKTVDAVGKDLRVSTSLFGKCGKSAQRVWVGDGGPHVRIRKMTFGGS